MDPAEAQDLVDARPLKYPESESDGEEDEEELELLGGEDSGLDTSPCGMSGSRALKRVRDDAEPESMKRLRGEGPDAPGIVGDVPQDIDCALPPGCGGLMGRCRLL
jgi:hypothetical protein